jgi:hypothetical protein
MQLIRNDKNILKYTLEANFVATGYTAKLTIKRKTDNTVFFTNTKTLSLEAGNIYFCLFDVVTFTDAGFYVYDVEVSNGTTYKKTDPNNIEIEILKDVNNS